MTERRLCRECPDAVFFDTGSSLFYLCRRGAEPKMRGYFDECSLLIKG